MVKVVTVTKKLYDCPTLHLSRAPLQKVKKGLMKNSLSFTIGMGTVNPQRYQNYMTPAKTVVKYT
jgi:hypothetical protein